MSARQPALYLPHGGGPCFFMDWTMGPKDTWDRMAEWLRAIPATLPEPPKALLVISAHWEESTFKVISAPAPPLLFDYYGFPPETYELTWPAAGEPALAARIRQSLEQAGYPCGEEAQRGFDHGVFIPLKLAFPDANTPVVQLSLRKGLSPAEHVAIGRVLEPLRDDGVLILGSGMSFHNMARFNRRHALGESERFDTWLEAACAEGSAGREQALVAWESAPEARQCHPREEHLLPLMVCAGAGGQEPGRVVFRDQVMGVVVSAIQFG